MRGKPGVGGTQSCSQQSAESGSICVGVRLKEAALDPAAMVIGGRYWGGDPKGRGMGYGRERKCQGW